MEFGDLKSLNAKSVDWRCEQVESDLVTANDPPMRSRSLLSIRSRAGTGVIGGLDGGRVRGSREHGSGQRWVKSIASVMQLVEI